MPGRVSGPYGGSPAAAANRQAGPQPSANSAASAPAPSLRRAPPAWPRSTRRAAAGRAGRAAGSSHRRVGGQPGALAGDGDRLAQAAGLVGQPVGDRVGAGPDPAAGQLVHPLGGQPPAVRHLLREVRVDRVEPLVDPRPLGLGERPGRGEHRGDARRPRRPRWCRSSTPARPNSSRSTGLPMKTPMDPVIVPGCATITSAGAAMK